MKCVIEKYADTDCLVEKGFTCALRCPITPMEEAAEDMYNALQALLPLLGNECLNNGDLSEFDRVLVFCRKAVIKVEGWKKKQAAATKAADDQNAVLKDIVF
ncbi:MAG: hypothetical protein ACLQF0_05585 [Dissulfurispiraceae bacterium]